MEEREWLIPAQASDSSSRDRCLRSAPCGGSKQRAGPASARRCEDCKRGAKDECGVCGVRWHMVKEWRQTCEELSLFLSVPWNGGRDLIKSETPGEWLEGRVCLTLPGGPPWLHSPYCNCLSFLISKNVSGATCLLTSPMNNRQDSLAWINPVW